MRTSVFALLVLALAGCAPRVGKFKDDHFAHEYHTYRIAYAGEGLHRMMGPEWEPVNWTPKDGARWSHKAGTEFTVSRTFDFDADGNQDYFRLEAIRDFDFKHRQHDARLWLQVLPMPANAKVTDLPTVAQQYLEKELPKPMGIGLIAGDGDACEVSGLSAMRVDFDVDGRRGRLVVIDPGQPEKVGPNNLDARVFYYAVLVGEPQAFADAEDDLVAFLDRLAVGTSKKTIPAQPTPTTCRARSGAETEAPVVELPEAETPEADAPEADAPESDVPEDEGEAPTVPEPQ